MQKHIRCAVQHIMNIIRVPSARAVSVSFLLVITFNSYLPFIQGAQVVDAQEQPAAAATPVVEPTNGPRVQYFDITAYYSPQPDQARYVTGSYASDIALNGSGVHGADGTPVYPGMVAAPSVYAFGTKMYIKGIGTVAVHDRGGAIVRAGSGLQYDRLDIWMGYGDTGLQRALGWGRRVIEVTIYGVDPSIKEEVSFAGVVSAEVPVKKNVKPPMFPEDVWYLSHGAEVVKLQKTLESLGYFTGEVNGFYGEETKAAVYAFQKDHNLFSDANELGAGHTGPATRLNLENAFTERKRSKLPTTQMGRGNQGDDVTKLQEILKNLGYDVKITGVFDDQTESALYQFQLDQHIVKSEKDSGAGYFGPKTVAALEKEYIASIVHNQTITVVDVPSYLVQDLSLNESGEAVRQLQSELRKLNFLKIEPTGLYGSVTAHAVFKFQQSQGLVASIDDTGAQVFGPDTRARLNEIIAARFHTKQIIAARNPRPQDVSVAGTVTAVATSKTALPLEEGLAKGDNGTQVLALQNFLAKEGYLAKTDITGTFGDRTEKALITFQKSHRVIVSDKDSGAGRVGPRTLALIQAFAKIRAV
ncbi:MAG: peptidoglycan-binding protein [Candidatus Peregrinibacteria bacterium]|nr:peptidoglycan-binding protein [Candidatus Peregrinibacteria bacterium]